MGHNVSHNNMEYALQMTLPCVCVSVGHHVSHDNMEYALQMELWKGNISGAIQLARERAQLSDWIVSLAPLGQST